MREYIILKYSLKSFIIFISGNFYYDLFSLLFIKIRTQQTFVLMRTSFVFVFRRRLQYVLIKANIIRFSHTSSKDVFKTFSRRLDQRQYIRPGHTSSRSLAKMSPKRFQDVFKTFKKRLKDIFKTFSRYLAKTSSRRLQSVFKTPYENASLSHLQTFSILFKTSSRCLAKTSSRHLQSVFKTFCKNVFITSSRHLQYSPRHFKDILQRYLQDVSSSWRIIKLNCFFNTSLTRIQHFSEMYCKDGYLQKDLPRLNF